MSATYTETKGRLVINLLDEDIFKSLQSSSQINLNELYFIPGEEANEVASVSYDSVNQKFTYTTVDGVSYDIVTVSGLKTILNYSTVAGSGNYNDLNNRPQINGVTLTGNKSTGDLGIALDYSTDSITNKPKINGVTLIGNISSSLLGLSYNDLDNKPTIPTVSSTYVAGDTSAALTSKGVEGALTNYVPTSRIVSGSGALEGGGNLTANRTITHKVAPTGLATSAKKIGVDTYGHVCAGDNIQPSDIGAMPLKTAVVTNATTLDGTNSSIVILGLQSETLGFTTAPELGKILTIQYVNTTSNSINVTIPNSLANNTYVNGTKLTSEYVLTVGANEAKRIDAMLVQNSGTTYAFVNIL